MLVAGCGSLFINPEPLNLELLNDYKYEPKLYSLPEECPFLKQKKIHPVLGSEAGWIYKFDFKLISTWILHESEAFICKALKGEAIVAYAEPLITKGAESAIRRIMKASGSPVG